MSAYLDRLPHGWLSYPECEASGMLVRWLIAHDALDRLEGLPPELSDSATWSRRPWMPEVVYVGTMLAILDATFGSDADQFLEWAADSSAERMAVSGETLNRDPVSVMTSGADLWASYHRGTPAAIEAVSQTSATFVIEHPAPLFPVALVRADGAQPRVDVHTDVAKTTAVTTMIASWLDPATLPRSRDGVE